MIRPEIIPSLPLFCPWCGDEAAGDHAPCIEAVRNLGVGYCTACGYSLGAHGQQHDDCMVFLTGRPDLLEPGPEDREVLERLATAAEVAVLDIAFSLPGPADHTEAGSPHRQARWN